MWSQSENFGSHSWTVNVFNTSSSYVVKTALTNPRSSSSHHHRHSTDSGPAAAENPDSYLQSRSSYPDPWHSIPSCPSDHPYPHLPLDSRSSGWQLVVVCLQDLRALKFPSLAPSVEMRVRRRRSRCPRDFPRCSAQRSWMSQRQRQRRQLRRWDSHGRFAGLLRWQLLATLSCVHGRGKLVVVCGRLMTASRDWGEVCRGEVQGGQVLLM